MSTLRRVAPIHITLLLLAATVLLAIPVAAHAETCPNEEFRVGFSEPLPDCRALEMVTPPYKSGQPTLWNLEEPPPLSTDGNHIIGIDFAGFAGTGNLEKNGAENGAFYEFSRTPSGWTTEALDPPASVASRSEFAFASSDLTTSLWFLSNQAGEHEELEDPLTLPNGYALARRELTPTGPRFRKLGPLIPPGAPNQGTQVIVRGASRDLSHVLYSITSEPGDLWPGDQTREGLKSLYEYVGVENAEPRLVGVDNAGAQISQCGTKLGFFPQDTFNAVSADGSHVYFTAQACEGEPEAGPAVNEIYARVDGSSTVDISEPSTEDCSACQTFPSAPESRSSALFQGASSNGSKVFFLSSQELLPAAAGENLYEFDLEGPPHEKLTLVAPAVSGVARLSDDGSHVYFVSTEELTSSPDLSLKAGAQVAVPGESNLYAYDTVTGKTQFVATLSEADGKLWQHSDANRPIETTPDGRFAVFTSAAQLTPDDSASVPQIFEYDAQGESLVRVSAGEKSAAYPDGFNDDGNTGLSEDAPSLLRTPQYSPSDTPTNSGSSLFVSESGMVVFTSGDVLTPQASPGRVLEGADYTQNVYEFRGGNVFLLSAASEQNPLQGSGMSRLLGIDQSGQNVFFYTANALLPQDGDTQADWYDARVDGGFPAPATSAGCEGEACQGPSGVAPVFGAPGSATFTGTSGNLVPQTTVLPKSVSKPKKTSAQARSERLSKALKSCKRDKNKKKQSTCEKSAHNRFGRGK